MTTQASELALAVPQVVAHRLARMVMSGPNPNSRDQREFQRMGAEKVAAFAESWNAMAIETFRANQEFALSFMRACRNNPWLGGWPSMGRSVQQVQSAALGILTQGMDPVHRRAVANAKRLGNARGR